MAVLRKLPSEMWRPAPVVNDCGGRETDTDRERDFTQLSLSVSTPLLVSTNYCVISTAEAPLQALSHCATRPNTIKTLCVCVCVCVRGGGDRINVSKCVSQREMETVVCACLCALMIGSVLLFYSLTTEFIQIMCLWSSAPRACFLGLYSERTMQHTLTETRTFYNTHTYIRIPQIVDSGR